MIHLALKSSERRSKPTSPPPPPQQPVNSPSLVWREHSTLRYSAFKKMFRAAGSPGWGGGEGAGGSKAGGKHERLLGEDPQAGEFNHRFCSSSSCHPGRGGSRSWPRPLFPNHQRPSPEEGSRQPSTTPLTPRPPTGLQQPTLIKCCFPPVRTATSNFSHKVEALFHPRLSGTIGSVCPNIWKTFFFR